MPIERAHMHNLMMRLFPICRSITGNGVRKTLSILGEELPNLKIHEVPSGTQVLDWIIPDEWNARSAHLTGPDGEIIADFSDHNLHLVGYSEPIDAVLPLEELQEHLHSRPDLPDAIPYVTSYYERRWGFCLTDNIRKKLRPGKYHAIIDSTLQPGSLTYGELILPGRTNAEVLLSTYICHPSMANNELSGPVVAWNLAKWLGSAPRKLTYRILFLPETIGAITYLGRHLEELQRKTIAGFVLTCLGDDRAYSYLPSRRGDTLADRVALHVLGHHAPEYVRYTFLDRGSDERQYCSPGVDLPVCSIMRTKYGEYPEYHTSLDNLEVVTESGLWGGFAVIRKCLEALEADVVYHNTILCEPQMGRRNLYPTLSEAGRHPALTADMMNVLAYTDGKTSLLEIADIVGLDILACAGICGILAREGILRPAPQKPGEV